MRTLIRWLLALLTLGLFATSVVAQSAPTRIRFNLDWRFEGPSAPFLLSEAKGYFREEGLQVQIDAGSGSSGTLGRVATGAYDMGMTDVNAMIEFLAQNRGQASAQLQAVFMIYDAGPAAVFALKKSGITKPADLAGRTLGAPVFDAGRKAFPVFAAANGIDPAKVKWTTMEPALREQMLLRGDVEAITGFYFTSLLNLIARGVKEEDIVAMRFRDHGVQLYGSAIVAHPRLVQENPQAIRGFLRAFTRGLRDTIADPDAAVQFVRQRDPLIDVALEQRRLKLAIESAIATPNTRANGVGAVNKLRLEETVAQVVKAFGLKEGPQVDGMFNSSFLPSRTERMVFAR
ncbi:MAG: ABC transporter substrate-binding protein [Burkholderiales bacterium]|nr:ABC transporter substrate-binding protein [Burkholderiales bacterium]